MTEKPIADQTLAEQALPVGTKLCDNQFTITALLGAGGFGITYRAKDNVLDRTIVIKECFPQDFCTRQGKGVVSRNPSFDKQMHSIVRMFVREARSLAKLRNPNVVGVHRAFEENETAYMALDLIDGLDLFKLIKPGATPLSPKRIKDILLQLLDAIEKVHEVDLLHRDISPDNIIIEKNGTPVLIDFGAARGDASRHTRAISSLLVVKDGYSPQEFYTAGSEQNPSSDLYALAATFYHVLSGEVPPNSQARMIEIVGKNPDPCVPLAGRIEGYDQAFLQAIDTAMQIHPKDRLQSAAKWKRLIADAATDTSSSPQSAARVAPSDVSLELELSLAKLVEETNDEVRKSRLIPVEPEKSVAPPKEKPSKPEWIEEFNRESLAPVSEPEPMEDEGPHLDEPIHFDRAEMENDDQSSDAHTTPERARSENNWVGLAVEKQEQIINEREAELDIFRAETEERPKSTLSQPPTEEATDELIETVVAAEVVPEPKSLPRRIAVGLVVCFSFAVFFQGV